MSIMSEGKINNRIKITDRTEWNTAIGKFVTTDKSSLSMKLTELSSSDTVNYDFNIHNGKAMSLRHDHTQKPEV